MKKCDALFSIKVRMLGAWEVDGVWYNKCYTHDIEEYRVMPIKKLQCGHYLSRYFKAARWNLDNVRPQCWLCNGMRKGMPVHFRANLVSEIGERRVLAVEALRDAPTKLTREFLTNLLKALEEKNIEK